VRTFAQALAAIDRIIVAPERTLTGGELQGAVVAGATANWSLPCTRSPGRPLMIDEPRRVEPLDET
jgi:hypothetical protein